MNRCLLTLLLRWDVGVLPVCMDLGVRGVLVERGCHVSRASLMTFPRVAKSPVSTTVKVARDAGWATLANTSTPAAPVT
jgi:hypothetical protein